MSNMPAKIASSQRVKDKPFHDKGRHTEQYMQARTRKQIQQATPVLKAWYEFLEASKQRVP